MMCSRSVLINYLALIFAVMPPVNGIAGDSPTEKQRFIQSETVLQSNLNEPKPQSDDNMGYPLAPGQNDVVLLLDNSGSMKKNDPLRLAKKAVDEFIRRLDDSTRLSIILFDQNVKTVIPLTAVSSDSTRTFMQSLDQLTYKGLYTDFPAAIERAIYILKMQGRPDAKKLVILLTDGIVDTGNINRDTEKVRWLKGELALGSAAAAISIIGIAFTENADFELLQSLAQKTDGEYYRALRADDLPIVFERIAAIIDEPVLNKEQTIKPVEQQPISLEDIAIEPPQVVADELQSPEYPARDRTYYVIGAAALAVLTLAIISFFIIRRRKISDKTDSKDQAYLYTLSTDSKVPFYKIDRKPVMLGRIAGPDAARMDYVVVPEATIGRRHALLEFEDFTYWITDQGSLNGTYVNDKLITEKTRLKHGDRIKLHKYEFELALPELIGADMTMVSNTMMYAAEQDLSDQTIVHPPPEQARKAVEKKQPEDNDMSAKKSKADPKKAGQKHRGQDITIKYPKPDSESVKKKKH